MYKLLKNNPFIIGFLIGIIFLLALNVFIYLNSSCHHCVRVIGVPFVFYEEFTGNIYYNPATGESRLDRYEKFYELNLIVDVVFTIGFGFLLGSIFKLERFKKIIKII